MHAASDEMKMQTKRPKSLQRRRKCKKMAQCVCCNFVSIPRCKPRMEMKYLRNRTLLLAVCRQTKPCKSTRETEDDNRSREGKRSPIMTNPHFNPLGYEPLRNAKYYIYKFWEYVFSSRPERPAQIHLH